MSATDGMALISQNSVLTTDVTRDTQLGSTWTWMPIVWGWSTILQLLSAAMGIVGNLLVMMVVFQRKSVRRSTDTMIGALALADFLTSVFLIPIPVAKELPSTWLGEFYCKVIFTARPMWISVSASVFTLTAISVERYIAVAYPFRVKILFTSNRINACICVVWLLAFVMNSFAFYIFFASQSTCVIMFPTPNGSRILGIISFLLVLVIPITIMTVTQALTGYILHRESQRFIRESANAESTSQHSARLLLAKKRVVKLLLIVNLTFVICWAPNQSAYLAFNLGLLDSSFLYGPVDQILVVLAFYNSCANPIIYTIQHEEFRVALRNLFRPRNGIQVPIFGNKFDTEKGELTKGATA